MGGKPRTIQMGDRNGRLVVTSYVPANKSLGRKEGHVGAECDCGAAHQVLICNWRRTFSCGCLRVMLRRIQSTTHGMKGTPEYQAWQGMKNRCYRKKTWNYSNYGGRGVTVCDAWRESFEAFYKDVGPRPFPEYSLDRIDNNGNYEPGNMRWTTAKVQANNRRPRRTYRL